MIELKSTVFASLQQGDVQGLRDALQQAVMLEHATIPAYLYALYSIRPDSLTADRNLEVYSLLRSVVLEEMVHMSLACNVLNAVGGHPVIDHPDFIPRYPGPLPGSVESGLTVGLGRFSKEIVHDVFMVIEEPEDPLQFPVLKAGLEAAPEPRTIGQFYAAIGERIKELGESAFTGKAGLQVSGMPFFPEVTPVTDVKSALAAIDLIVEQGEGTATSPLDPEHEVAHYYKFAEIWHGRRLIATPDPDPRKPQFAYAGPPIPFDPSGVWPVVANPHADLYPAGSTAAYANNTFNFTYTSLLRSLHATFNGQPGQMNAAIGLMESLKQQAIGMMSTPLRDGTTAGPTFQYQPVLG